MIIKSLELSNFRNYAQLKIDFSGSTNILFGDNAQGKTNILEAISVAGTTRSHKGCRDREMIRFGEEESHIRALVEKNGDERQIDIHLKKSQSKGIAVNRVPIRKAADLFGILNIVFFSPEDMDIIREGPSQRRRFLDMELSQLDRIYLSDLGNYNKVLSQRNQLLKDLEFQPELADTLAVWNLQLLEYGRKIIRRRSSFIHRLNDIVVDIHRNITGDREKLVLKYEPDAGSDEFEQRLLMQEETDLRLRTTTVGPHRDDIRFEVNGIDIRKYGSQGQQRTAALSLKLSEIELVREMIQDTPVLLLDDVLSELDQHRQNDLLNQIHDVQTIITCTGLDEFVKNRFPIDKVFFVKEGTVTEQEEFE